MSNVVRPILLMASAVVSVMIAMAVPALAYPPVPQLGTPCPATSNGALAAAPTGGLMECTGGRWIPSSDPAARSDRWLTYGPALQLAGPWQVNPQVAQGIWVAHPQDTSTQCSITQVVVVNPPDQTVTRLSTGDAGRELDVEILQRSVLATLSGNCLWDRQS